MSTAGASGRKEQGYQGASDLDLIEARLRGASSMQGSWSLETTVLKPLLLGYTLHLLTRYNGDGDRLGSMAAAEHSYQ